MPVQVIVSGAARATHAYVIAGGAARYVPQIYVNVGGVIHALYSYYWALGAWGGCSASCGGGVQYRTVTCTRNDGVTVGDEVCSKLVGERPAGSQGCNSQSCISCRYQSGVNAYVSYQYHKHGNNYWTYAWIVNSQTICTSSSCPGYTVGNVVEQYNISSELQYYGYEICGAF